MCVISGREVEVRLRERVRESSVVRARVAALVWLACRAAAGCCPLLWLEAHVRLEVAARGSIGVLERARVWPASRSAKKCKCGLCAVVFAIPLFTSKHKRRTVKRNAKHSTRP